MLGYSPHAARVGLLNNAELVVWQSSRRLAVALAIGVIGVLLRAVGLVHGPSWPFLAVVPAYIAIVALVTVVIERTHRASRAMLVILAIADVAAIFIIVGLVTTPAFYPRALLLSLLAVQFTQMFFGRAPTVTVIVTSALAYGALMLGAWELGMNVAWADEAWLLALYLVVALHGMAIQASANRRLAALVDLFAGAQRGDFSRSFVEARDHEPDGITLLGRAYNHLRSELATMVLSDTLTGCLNRRGFDQLLHHNVSVAVRRSGELALLAIDIDHFKTINDTIGHLAGDAILRELADLLSRSARAGDVVGRVGGEEFVVLLPGADNETAGVVAERIMATVRGHAFRTARGRQRVTVSIGIASEQITDAHIAGAIRARSDEALYVAKRLGRDRVVMWAPGIRSNATPPWTGMATFV
ncbi:MAG TPA: GGDEF domain-containing protein [Gemmatimonadaceae bacterium]|jgi:diguanylate cyclase (GGDEF)-like protein